MRVSGAQLDVTRDISRNLGAILHAIERAASDEADILLTPEGSLSGYTPQFGPSVVRSALKTVTSAAANARVGLALGTYFVEDDGQCYNQIRFYSRDGDYLGFHSKILRCGTMEVEPRGKINDYATSDLRTFSLEGTLIGGLICNDFWANPGCTPVPDPYLLHQLANLGTQIVFQAVTGGRNGSDWARDVIWPFHESNLRLRTSKASVWTVVVDSAHPETMPCSCPSGVISPKGRWMIRTNPTEADQFTFDIDLE